MGETGSLTTGVDGAPAFTGGAGDDTYTALVANDGTDDTSTWSALDALDGGAGNDVLNINSISVTTKDGINLAQGTLANIETINIQAVADIGYKADGTADDALDVSGIAGLTTINTTKSVNTKLLAADTQDVNVSGATGAVVVDGGKNISVSTGTANSAITIGAVGGDSEAAGTITVTNTDQGTGAIKVDGGTDVTVTTTSEATGTITVGDQAGNGIAADESDIASGIITITQNLEDDGTGAFTGGAIATEGGTDVNITVNANSVAEADNSNADITVGAIGVVGGDDTTTVTVTQNDNSEQFTTENEGGNVETASVKFGVLKDGDSLEIDGLTFTATKDLTAAQVAAAFANLTSTDTQSAGGVTANGIYTGTVGGNWTSGAASGDTVIFTSTQAIDVVGGGATDVTDLDDATLMTLTNTSTNSVAPVVTTTDGTDATSDEDSSANATVFGAVTIADGGTDSITTVTVDGYATSSTLASDVLQTLTLKNSATNATFAVTNTTADSDLVLNIDNINSTGTAAISVDGSAGKITDLTINATGSESRTIITAAGLTDLTINASVDLDLSDSTTAGLGNNTIENITITGAGAVTFVDEIQDELKLNTFDASGNTGGVTATIETEIDATKITGDITEYIFSEGNDTVTLLNTTIETDITLGAGDDTLKFKANATATATTTASAATLDGGTGTNTISMAAADAEAVSGTATFEAQMSGFSKLNINAAIVTAVQEVVNLANMDDLSYVITNGSTDAEQYIETTITGSTDNASDTVSIVVDGVTYTTAAGLYATATDVAAALVTAINAGSGDVTATSTGAVLELTGDTSYDLFTVGAITATTGGGAADTVTKVDAVKSSQLTLNNMANNGTVQMNAVAGLSTIVSMTDADASTDVLNIVTGGTAKNVGTLTVADVETINVTTTDTFTDDAAVVGTADDGIDDVNSAVTLTVAATSAATVNVDGAGDLTLYTGSTVLETVDATDMTGKLTYVATLDDLEVIGGSAGDALTASGDSNVINGGAGADTLTAGDLASLTGGAGNDIFKMVAGVSVSKYATIEDAQSGDQIDVDVDNNGTYDFIASEFTYASTAGFTDVLNQAIAASDAEDVMWFQYGSNTYILVNESNDAAAYDATADSIIMINGLVDLSTASFNDAGIIEIA